ncbi:Putative LOC100742483, partial [Caligus rogercresseyi]
MDKSYGSVISEIPLFRGPENDPIPLKEQKKIQIDIRRPIRSGKSSPGPIKRGIKDPTKLTLPRREKEGRKCLFDREEIKNWKKEVVGPETRAPNNTTAAAASSHPSNSASKLISTERSSHRRAEDLRSRLETEGGDEGPLFILAWAHKRRWQRRRRRPLLLPVPLERSHG